MMSRLFSVRFSFHGWSMECCMLSLPWICDSTLVRQLSSAHRATCIPRCLLRSSLGAHVCGSPRTLSFCNDGLARLLPSLSMLPFRCSCRNWYHRQSETFAAYLPCVRRRWDCSRPPSDAICDYITACTNTTIMTLCDYCSSNRQPTRWSNHHAMSLLSGWR